MKKWKQIVRLICLFYNLNGGVHGATHTVLGIRLTDACKGFISLNSTINCVSCSSMCHVLLQGQNDLDPECTAVQIDSSDTLCTQAKTESGQILCFDNKILSDDQMTLINDDQVTSAQPYPYIGGLTDEDVVKYVPLVRTDPPLPEFTHPMPPFEKWGLSPSVLFDHGLLVCRERFGACAHWPFRSNTWTPMPKPLIQRYGSGLGIWKGRPVAPGGLGSNGRAIESVEMFNPNKFQWTDGPRLAPARAYHAVVQVDAGSIIVVGGIDTEAVGYTDLLSSGDTEWKKLPDRPEATFNSICGVVNLGDKGRGILSIGGFGELQATKRSFFFAFGSLTWSPVPGFDAPYESYVGSLIQAESRVYFIPVHGRIPGEVRPYVKDVNEVNSPWKEDPLLFQGLGSISHLNVMNLMVFNMTTK